MLSDSSGIQHAAAAATALVFLGCWARPAVPTRLAMSFRPRQRLSLRRCQYAAMRPGLVDRRVLDDGRDGSLNGAADGCGLRVGIQFGDKRRAPQGSPHKPPGEVVTDLSAVSLIDLSLDAYLPIAPVTNDCPVTLV